MAAMMSFQGSHFKSDWAEILIVLQLSVHPLIESYFRLNVTLSRRRPWPLFQREKCWRLL